MTTRRARTDLFLISLLLLFLELACIRWFPAHVLFLTFFTNTILLASFLGMSLGCLAARRGRHLLPFTPPLLFLSMFAAQVISAEQGRIEQLVRVGNPLAPQLVFFGTEYAARDPARFIVPVEVVEGFFFLIVALLMAGPGQELGRAFNRVPRRLEAYSLNILGSLTGIGLFALCSWREWPPLWWFVPIVVLIGYFLLTGEADTVGARRWRLIPSLAPWLAGALVATTWTSGTLVREGATIRQFFWSPYYRIDYVFRDHRIAVNLIGHQEMVSRDDALHPAHAYALPHLLQRDAGGPKFQNVLVIGAGSGNDVSRALAWGAGHVDAVEIDPAIRRIGALEHPDQPYSDPRVSVHITDGRNFLRTAGTQYDLIVFALVDSLVLHSGYSNIRLESFMFTREALADVRARLAPDGVVVMYNFFREGWIVGRLNQELAEVFNAPPLVLTLPYLDTVQSDTSGGFTVLMSGNIDRLRQAFARHSAYWLRMAEVPSPASPNGFDARPAPGQADQWLRFGPARVLTPGDLRSATDDWPFLYLRRPMIPDLSLRGAGVMGAVALGLLLWVRRWSAGAGPGRFSSRMFFLGAGFMLIETKAVVHMALLFGSTWMVNTVVFAAVLAMILGANAFVARVRPASLAPYYAGLMIALGVNLIVPLNSLLGLPRGWQIAASSALAFAPILFAGVIFAVAFDRSDRPDQDFGANVAGAMVGGLAENSSMLLGFQHLTVVVIAFYALSALFTRTPANRNRPLSA